MRLWLSAILVFLATASCVAAEKSERISREIGDILAQPEYNRSFSTGEISKFWQAVLKALGRFLSWLTELLSTGDSVAGRLASIIFASLVVLAFLVLLAFVIRRLIRTPSGRVEDDVEIDAYAIPSPRPLMKQAERLAKAGDFRGAFRCAYLASIVYLDEIGAVRYERSRTNWEYLRELGERGHESIRGDLKPLTLDFDRKFYGREQCQEADYLRAVDVFRKLSAEARA